MSLRIPGAYMWALVPEQPDPARPFEWQVIKAEGSQERLADRVTTKLRQGGLLATSYGARNVRMDLDGPLASVWQPGHVALGALWSYYRRYPYLTRLRDRAVLEGALRAALDEMMWELEGFALADRFDAATGTYEGLASYNGGSIGQLHDQVLVVHPKVAAAQQQKAAAAATSTTTSEGTATGPAATGPGTTSSAEAPETPAAPKETRFYGAVSVNPERYGRDFTRVAQEVLQHLAAVDGTELEVTVEITARNAGGFPPDKIRVVSENAKTLKFEPFGFEAD